MPRKLHSGFTIIGIAVYLLALLIVSLWFRPYALRTEWWLWGIGTVVLFFMGTYYCYQRWQDDDRRKFLMKVFWTAFLLHAVYVVAMVYYYYYRTGLSLEYGAADSINYHLTASHFADDVRQGHIRKVFQSLNNSTTGFSDQGYILYLTSLYTLFGKNVLGPRLVKALMSAWMCVTLYRLAERNLDEKTARVTAVMAMLLPQFFHYNGTYLKETELIFLATLAMERFDYLIHSKRYRFWNILWPIVLTALTFGFRTIVGMILIGSYVVTILFSETALVGKKAKVIGAAAVLLTALVFLVTPIGKEMVFMFQLNFKESGYLTWKYQLLGLKYAEYAHYKYMAPGAFVLPLTNLVEVANPSQKLMNGTYFVKNYLAFFAMWGIVVAFREKQVRNFRLIGSYTLVYILVIAFSFAANSERYHLPALPGFLVLAAFAMTHFQKKDRTWYYAYCGLLLLAIVAWNYLKLSARGLIP